MNRHTTAWKGKRIHIILKNGRQFTEKLIESKTKFYEFEHEGRVMKEDIRSFSINRNQTSLNTT